MSKEECTVYDKTKLYKSDIEPLVKEIEIKCKLNNIPFVCTFAIKNDAKDTVYKNTGVLTGSMGVHLTDDCFENYLVALQKNKRIVLIDSQRLTDEQTQYIDEMYDDEETDKGNKLMDDLNLFDGEL